ncbi:MAG: c-type cytochrome [Verrucomicrobiales bacterium]|nr:c-type cytochrome [Verrucomicrobiales bacterium]
MVAGGWPAGVALAAEDPFEANVRPTEPKTPAEQRAAFTVPDGFAVQLVAAEPDIHKPMNLAFDVTGRLWVTTSREYPRPVAVGTEGRDRVMIFSDLGPDGRPGKVTTFATGLNIPIGVYPFRSPSSLDPAARGARDGKPALPEVTWKAVVWSIPHVWLMEDTDGDGAADKKQPWFGPFDHTRDTHGNQASFRRGYDGWLYATHGFNNDSHVTGRDGHRVDMNSGNTYRMRLDGTRLEHHTWGQVNPFGLAWDPEGNLYSSDCHSDPIYLLQAGGYYPSFGKPHDGLGFAPNMMEKIRGTTAIDGMTYYADDLWPAEYQDSLFVGDVMLSRVFRDRAVLRGSARIARPAPDFLVSADPWFRPVDMTLGPDGALYVADFYNRIIGHYEVLLDHPGRDRERGRIWRVIPTAKALRAAALPADADGLLAELASPSLTRRMLAASDLADRWGAALSAKLEGLAAKPVNTAQAVQVLWLRHRLGTLAASELQRAAGSEERLMRLHAQRLAADVLAGPERGTPGPAPLLAAAREIARVGLSDRDPMVVRCAAEAVAVAAEVTNVEPLVAALARASAEDVHLRYGLRRALSTQLRDERVMTAVLENGLGGAAAVPALMDVVFSVRSESAARLILRHLDYLPGEGPRRGEALAHAARHVAPAEVPALMTAVRKAGGGDVDIEAELFRSVRQGSAQRGAPMPADALVWGADLAARLLAASEPVSGWTALPTDGLATGGTMWDRQVRRCADGQEAVLVSSHPRGEDLTGVLRSPEFAAAGRLSFYVAGHDGIPEREAGGRNLVRLVDAANGAVLRSVKAPRQDVAQWVEWDLTDLGGRRVAVEIVDGDTGDAYAWIAAGRWSPALGREDTEGPATRVGRLMAAAEVAAETRAAGLAPALERVARSATEDPAARAAAARALVADPALRAAADVVGDTGLPWRWRAGLADVVFQSGTPGLEAYLESVWKDAPRRFQVRVASIAGASAPLAGGLIRRMAEGRAPTGLLLDTKLRDRLRGAADDAGRRELDQVLASLPSEDAALAALLESRRRGHAVARLDLARGREVFKAGCAPCHQLRGEGGLVGPQLTGIGTRGVERLCEDILAPNRNVDRAFWTTTLTLKDGESVTGLFRREEGALLVLANAAGAEVQVPKADVASRSESAISVMPANFGEALSAEDYHHLLGYLMAAPEK